MAFCFQKFTGKIPFAVSGTNIFYIYRRNYLKCENNFIFVIGDIVPGLPAFKLPNFSTVYNNETINFIDMAKDLGSGIFVIPIVAVLQNIAIAKAFCK